MATQGDNVPILNGDNKTKLDQINECTDEKHSDNVVVTDMDSGKDTLNGGNESLSKQNENGIKVESSKDLLVVARGEPRKSFMEEECAKEKTRLSLLKQCSAILKQSDERYTKETLHRTFQDEDLLERIFRLFDADRKDYLVQDDWLEFLKQRLTDEKQLELVEQVESVAYVVCGHGHITPHAFRTVLQNKVVTNKLLKVVDKDGDGCVTADEIMEFLSMVTSSRPQAGFDKSSVDRLEQLFRQTVGDQKEITKEQFRNIVDSKNSFFTERVFQIFDEDNSGAISLQEFIAAAHRFAGHSPDDKIRFLFEVYDMDGDGLIQHRELQHVMWACMEENGMQFSDEQLQQLTRAMFEDADTEHRGAITYEALRHQLTKHDGLLENLSISIDRWLVPPKPEPERISLWQRLQKLKPYQLSVPYFKNNYVFLIYLLLFTLVNVGLFVSRLYEYWDAGVFTMLARACGQCLNFNCAWVLVLMLRRCMTQLRVRGAGALLPLDHHIYLHKLTGVLIVLYSLLHTVMHLCNFSLVVVNDTNINANNFTLYEWLLTERPRRFGLVEGCANPTGLALLLILLVMYVCSQPFIRRGGSFEVFYWTHLLYVPFWLLLIFHGPNFWKWFVVPGTIYIAERIIRLAWLRSERGNTYVSSGILLPSRVTHLVVKRPPLFDFHAGDYVFINIPAIATYEWHPFTISSAPDQPDYIWLHIRGVGEWTNRLYSYFEREHARLHAPPATAATAATAATTPDDRNHSPFDRSISCESRRSSRSRRSAASGKKRSVDFAPVGHTNDAFDGDVTDNGEVKSPTTVPVPFRGSSLLTPLRFHKTHSMPNVFNTTIKKQRQIALRDYMRSESESRFGPCSPAAGVGAGGAAGGAGGAGGARGAGRGALHNRALAHSFRYMRNKPAVVAFKTPSYEDCERRRSNDSILTIARRRLSKSLSPDKDIEAEKPSSEVVASTDTVDGEFADYPIGKPLEVFLDGPYGAASSHIFRAQHAALIAAGIGVTPFASILQSIMYRYWSARRHCPRCLHSWASDLPHHNMTLNKVDFFWINREQRSFEWFVSLLSQLEMEQAEQGGAERFLDMHMYITSALQRSDMKAVGLQLALDLLHEKEKRDLITGLKTRTNAGRPNWDKVFKQLQEQHKGKVTVFYCGPPQLARALRLKCDQFGFHFRKEVF
ncbi:NADPH oxidase 5-like [Achroia grisella]|uniref:NADPH oxidase 5-like n=1 Tax=Achroia grisella TaxID=688607 RepID=UPI0027D2064D|nr:NADPH oxidase 5-like [Achroia grisella]XP_059056076.1 NADPH oxidase 5-like [Achroia grisella]XP_059056077.1 NADPH oxidase 5-like [Achroia grisella]